jgi:hypothetical protein
MERERRSRWLRLAGYWITTVIIANEMAAGAMWDLLRVQYVRGVFDHLGYPHYLLLILGAWKLPCALVLLLPRFGRLKEWAYAGAFFNYSGAAASHLLVGDGVARWLGPAIFGLLTLASWALRPSVRRLASPAPAPETHPVAWLASVGAAVIMVIFALITLPGR